MADSNTPEHTRIRINEFLKGRAPYSVVDRGIERAQQGHVSECNKVGSQIRGVVADDAEQAQSICLNFISADSVDAQCSCAPGEESMDQWCHHAVALLWRAHDLGFLEHQSGFSSQAAVARAVANTPEEIATVITEISRVEHGVQEHPSCTPTVQIQLQLASDRLGVQVRFDGEAQGPELFQGLAARSTRALDNLLVRILEDEGSWDDSQRLWFINSSHGIELILGIIEEYHDVVSASGPTAGRAVQFAREVVHAELVITWTETGAELSMHWRLPGGIVRQRTEELLGTGPHWVVVDSTIYRISPNASRIAGIFPHCGSLIVSRNRVGPVLEALTANLYDPTLVRIHNPALQPESEIAQPTPILHLERREQAQQHFASHGAVEITGRLEFEYPSPPANVNIVYLPDRDRERECMEFLRASGFEYEREARRYVVRGDAALDFISRGKKSFGEPWVLRGLEVAAQGVRFSDLSLNIAISTAPQNAKSRKLTPDWFECQVTLLQNRAHVPMSTLFKTMHPDSTRWIRLESGAFAEVPGGGLANLKTTLGLLDPNFRLSNAIRTRLSTAQALSLTRLPERTFSVTLDDRLKKLAEKLTDFNEIEPVKISKEFLGKLRPYQHEGLNWLNFLRTFELGGILADEMGLGKTVQTLSLLQHIKEEGEGRGAKTAKKGKKAGLPANHKPTLVVAPTSVIMNWVYEARRFTPNLKTLFLHGAARKAMFAEIDSTDVVITSYALLRLDRNELERHDWRYIILDEAQNIKNPDAATTKAAKALTAERRLALTGTPTENRPLELWSILDFLMPGYLGTHDFFRNQIEKPILEGGPGVQITAFLNSKTRPFILRRTKAEVEKDLPPKVESVLHVAMTPSQRNLYAQILEEVRPRVFAAVEKVGVRRASVSILAALLRLRQVCNHPNSIDALKEMPGFDSGKFGLLKDLVTEALSSGRKILLFGQFREMLAIIRRWLESTNVPFLQLDGTTRNRQELVDRFNSDPEIKLFLISLKAGGTGLNLAAADTVIIYDPWWNPAVESQAVDRAHRIGQTRTVNVYRLVTEDSIEQKIMALKDRKSKIVDALVNDNGLSTLTLSKVDLEQLFSPLPIGSGSDEEGVGA